jgi:O-antigen ligase
VSKFWKFIKKAVKHNPTIVYGWASVGSTYIVKQYPEVPNELVILTLLSFLGLSHQVQRIEDKKTEEALYTTPPKGE